MAALSRPTNNFLEIFCWNIGHLPTIEERSWQALAQKKGAKVVRARMAEEQLIAERKSTVFWWRQAQGVAQDVVRGNG